MTVLCRRNWYVGPSVLGMSMLMSSPSFATTPCKELAHAERLTRKASDRIDEATRMVDTSRFEDAEKEFVPLQRQLEEKGICSPYLLFHLARAQEGIYHLARAKEVADSAPAGESAVAKRAGSAALANYREVSALAEVTQPWKWARWARFIQDAQPKVAELEELRRPRLSLRIEAPFKPKLKVTMDDSVEITDLSKQIIVNSGSHIVNITAEGYHPERVMRDFGEWETKSVVVALREALAPPPSPSRLRYEIRAPYLDTFTRGTEEAKTGNWEKALAEFKKSDALAPTSHGMFNIAKCEQRLGRVARAFVTFKAVITAGDRVDLPAWVGERAHAAVEQLESNVSKISISVGPSVTSILVDGKPLDVDSMTGGAYTVAPKRSSGTARPPPRGSFLLIVDRTAEVHEIVVVQNGREVRYAWGPGREGIDVPEPQPPQPPPSYALGTALALGTAASLASGAFFGALAKRDFDEALSNPLLCPNHLCSNAGIAKVDSGKRKGNAATASFVIAGGLGVGTFLAFTLPRAGAATRTGAPALRLTGAVGPNTGALFFEGTFQ